MGANVSTVMIVVALADWSVVGVLSKASPRAAGGLLDRRVGVGGRDARGRGRALAARSVAGSRARGRGCCRASPLAAGSLAPLAAGGRARVVLVVGVALGGLALLTALVPTLPKPSGPHSVGSVIFRWTDNQRARDVDRRSVGSPAGHRAGVVPDGRDDGPGGSVLRGARPSAVVDRRGCRPSCSPRSGASRLTRSVAAPVSGAQRTWPVLVVLARAVDPARGVHGSLRRPCQSRLRGRRAQRALRVSRSRFSQAARSSVRRSTRT